MLTFVFQWVDVFVNEAVHAMTFYEKITVETLETTWKGNIVETEARYNKR